MKQNNHVHRGLLMLIGVLLNYGLYGIAHVYHLPMWLDTVGTVYVAVVLEPAAGLIVAFATNFLQSAVLYGTNSIIYYLVGASSALLFGLLLRKQGRLCWARLPLAALSYAVLGSLLSWLLTLWRTGGVNLNSGWESHFMTLAEQVGVPGIFACLFGILVLKVADSLILMVATPLLTALTPKSWRTERLESELSIHAPLHPDKKAV